MMQNLMKVREFVIPALLVAMISDGRLRREIGSWPLRRERDHYGNLWESELGEVYHSAVEIKQTTEKLPVGFDPELEGAEDEWSSAAGFIPYINDFSKIVEFGMSGDGAPFCLDYREQPDEPSVIWWDDVYWRRVAPSFADFIALFDLSTP